MFFYFISILQVNYDAAKNALSKLEKDGILQRELRGIYKISNYNSTLKIEVPANPDEIALAIAKNNKWSIEVEKMCLAST